MIITLPFQQQSEQKFAVDAVKQYGDKSCSRFEFVLLQKNAFEPTSTQSKSITRLIYSRSHILVHILLVRRRILNRPHMFYSFVEIVWWLWVSSFTPSIVCILWNLFLNCCRFFSIRNFFIGFFFLFSSSWYWYHYCCRSYWLFKYCCCYNLSFFFPFLMRW